MPDEEYITVAQASRRFGLSTGHISRLLKESKIQGIRPGHDWLVKPSAVMGPSPVKWCKSVGVVLAAFGLDGDW